MIDARIRKVRKGNGYLKQDKEASEKKQMG